MQGFHLPNEFFSEVCLKLYKDRIEKYSSTKLKWILACAINYERQTDLTENTSKPRVTFKKALFHSHSSALQVA